MICTAYSLLLTMNRLVATGHATTKCVTKRSGNFIHRVFCRRMVCSLFHYKVLFKRSYSKWHKIWKKLMKTINNLRDHHLIWSLWSLKNDNSNLLTSLLFSEYKHLWDSQMLNFWTVSVWTVISENCNENCPAIKTALAGHTHEQCAQLPSHVGHQPSPA